MFIAGLVVGAVALIAVATFIGATISAKRSGDSLVPPLVVGGIITALMTGVAILLIVLSFTTEAGKRQWKSWTSNTDGGLNRVVTVYGMNGQEIKKYSGKFDVDHDENRVIFDDENGMRHIIYYPTGTVTVDEVQ